MSDKPFKFEPHKPIESLEELRQVVRWCKEHPEICQKHWEEWLESRPDIAERVAKEKSRQNWFIFIFYPLREKGDRATGLLQLPTTEYKFCIA